MPIESAISIEHEISSKYSLVYPIKTGNNERFILNVCSHFDYNMLYSNTLNKYHPGIIILFILAGLHEKLRESFTTVRYYIIYLKKYKIFFSKIRII